MQAHQCFPCRFMPPGTCSFPPHPALTHAKLLSQFGTNPFSHPPLLHSSLLWCLQITCLCKGCLCLHEDWLAGASPTHLPSWLPPPCPRLLSSLAFHQGTGTGLSWALLHRPRWLPSTPGRLCIRTVSAGTLLCCCCPSEEPTAAAPLLPLLHGCLSRSLALQTLTLLCAPL